MKSSDSRVEQHEAYDPFRLFVDSVPQLAKMARNAANSEAYSYRNFLVGVAGFFINPSASEPGMLSAGNLKSARSKEKVCAEKKVLGQARKAGFTRAVGLVIAGTTDVELIEGVNDVAAPTLHPCTECRLDFEGNPLIGDDTLIITTGLENDRYQVHTYNQIRDLYKSGKIVEDSSRNTGFGFADWEQHLDLYDQLTRAEAHVSEGSQRSRAMIAQMALLTALK